MSIIINIISFEIDPLYSGQVHHLLHVIHPSFTVHFADYQDTEVTIRG